MSDSPHDLYRMLPAMSRVLDALTARPEYADLTDLPRPLLREHAEIFMDSCRGDIAGGRLSRPGDLDLEALLPALAAVIRTGARPHFRRVINATGVVLHTNLGRGRLAAEAVAAVRDAAAHYANLEFDLDTGARGSRYSHVEKLIRRLTGAGAALVVNNNAAAVLLTLDTLCKDREVVVSRGELVEIGGSFRIPEVMEKSGCRLREVGATNRTHTRDYEQAINERTAALMKVHTSNFRVIGFTGAVERGDLAALAHTRGLPLIEDLGSGNLFDFAGAGFPHLAGEPTVGEALSAGVDVVTFSGDKLLGGPQAGIIAGSEAVVARIKGNPLNRALRIDKLTLAALEATLRLYLDPQLARRSIPTLRMLCLTAGELAGRAARLSEELRRAGLPADWRLEERPGVSRSGGGAFPERDLPTVLVLLHVPRNPNELRDRLLRAEIPLAARVEGDALCLDPRTLEEEEYLLAARAVSQAASGQL